MKVYLAQFFDCGDTVLLGVYSTRELAQESINKYRHNEVINWTGDKKGLINEFTVDSTPYEQT